MPEDTHPQLTNQEETLIFYTLPMALNYQRNSYKLWEAATATHKDPATRSVFAIEESANMPTELLREKLTKHKLALQPNKHIDTWQRISQTINTNWGSITTLITEADSDYLKLRDILQREYKKGFPYLSGPKIFNYWSYILTQYCGVTLENRNYIEIAPDTHVIQASIRLGVLTKQGAEKMSREEISQRWREILDGSGIDPIDVHSPLWFWSRGGFEFTLT